MHDPEQCKSFFVSWQWMAATVTGLVLALSALAWTGSAKLTKLEIVLEDTKTQLLLVRGMQDDLDTIKQWIRP